MTILPNIIAPNTPMDANKVQENFEALDGGVSNLSSTVDSVEASIASKLSTLKSNIDSDINKLKTDIDTKAKKDMSNVTASSSAKATFANYAMPNFSSSTSVSSGTTISKNGWLRIKLKCDYGNDVYVRSDSTTGTILAGIDWTRKQDYSGTYFWYFVPVAKSTKIYFTGTTDYVMQCTFFPCIGG